jgi:hypothetical protein
MARPRHGVGVFFSVFLLGLGLGCGERTSDEAPDPQREGAGESADELFEAIDRAPRLEVGEAFPDLLPVPVAGGEPFAISGWTAIALAPADCAICESHYTDWAVGVRIWPPGLEFLTISERDVDRLAATYEREAPGYAMYATATPLFEATNEFDIPAYVLVDPEGIVRFRARESGTDAEKLESLRRNFKYLSASNAMLLGKLSPVLPMAAEFEIADGREHAAFDAHSATLGVSPWYGVGRTAAGDIIGHVFAIERDTDCDVCDPLYLAVGVSVRGPILGIATLEPVISDAEPVDMTPLFEAARGADSNERLAAIEAKLSSRQADVVARKILATALIMGKRLRE